MRQLAESVRQCHIVAVQEIKGKDQTVPDLFLTKMNSLSGAPYAESLSERTGKQADDKSSQEQYAYYYDTSTIEGLGTGALFDDAADDHFQREPYVARFSTIDDAFDFVLITVHTKPARAV